MLLFLYLTVKTNELLPLLFLFKYYCKEFQFANSIDIAVTNCIYERRNCKIPSIQCAYNFIKYFKIKLLESKFDIK